MWARGSRSAPTSRTSSSAAIAARRRYMSAFAVSSHPAITYKGRRNQKSDSGVHSTSAKRFAHHRAVSTTAPGIGFRHSPGSVATVSRQIPRTRSSWIASASRARLTAARHSSTVEYSDRSTAVSGHSNSACPATGPTIAAVATRTDRIAPATRIRVPLHRIDQGCEAEITCLERRYDRRRQLTAFVLGRPEHRHRLTELLDVVEHEERRFRETEVLHRLRDLTVLDQPQSIARQPCRKEALPIEYADVRESRDQQPPPGRADHLLD